MNFRKPPQHKGQGALEYLLLCGIVSFVALLSFAPNGFLSKSAATSKSYYNTIASVVQGESPKPIAGGWCNPVRYPDGRTFRTCECPAPAFGGAQCDGAASTEPTTNLDPVVNPPIDPPPPSTTCGDGIVDPITEQCDNAGQNGNVCTANYGEICSYCTVSCQKVFIHGGRCGDGQTQAPNEQCDLGGTTNGKECVPLYGEDCPWCDSSCGAKIMIGEKCGDGVLNGPEQCDDGVTNGQPCDPEYLGGCTYCGTDCKVKNLVGTHCGDGVIQTDKGEECDLGTGPNGNGKVCTVPYNGAETCTYCSPGCALITVSPPKCGDNRADVRFGEECDGSAYCTELCKCESSLHYPDGLGNCLSKCGNNQLDSGEECDTGAQNGNACTVDYNDQDCIYCGSTCSKITVVSEKCGDGIVQAIHDEKCDTKDDIKCKSDCSTCIEFYHSDDAGVCQANVCANAVFMPPNSQLCNSNPPVTHNSPYTLLPAGCGTVTEPCDVECKSRYIFDSGLSRCTLCGNGTVDTGNGELCDKKEDAHCKTDCSNCMRQYHTNASLACVENACGRLPENTRTCNSVLPDDHEQGYQIVGRCDPGAACQAECDGVFVYNGNQGCTICGNNRVDTAMGEVCDFSMPDANCKENCSGCNEYFHSDGTKCVANTCSSLPDHTRKCNNVSPLKHGKDYIIENGCTEGVACQAECDGIYIYDGNHGCTTCGNTTVDTALGEKCDQSAGDTHCNATCSGCEGPYHLNAGETTCSANMCDATTLQLHWKPTNVNPPSRHNKAYSLVYSPASTTPCDAVCESPYTNANGVCVLCGNSQVDRNLGEQCDPTANDSHCQTDCSGCKQYYHLNPNELTCTANTCVADPPANTTACTTSLMLPDTHNQPYIIENTCTAPCQATCSGVYIYDGNHGCTTCGNGAVDNGELCDKKNDSNCNASCSGCNGPYHLNPGDTTCRINTCDAGTLQSTWQSTNTNAPSTHNQGYQLQDSLSSTTPCDATCRAPYTRSGQTCVLCGNTKVDTDLGEVCDPSTGDVNCNESCSGCIGTYHVNAGDTRCSINQCAVDSPDHTIACTPSPAPINHGQAYKIEGECNPAVACQATCTGDYVYDNNNACTTCGNRKVDIAFEQCDRSTGDSNCVADCSGCSTGYHVNTTTNQCEVDSCPSLLEPRYGSCTFPATGSVVEGRFVTRSTNTPNYTGNVTLTCRNGQFVYSNESCYQTLRCSTSEQNQCIAGDPVSGSYVAGSCGGNASWRCSNGTDEIGCTLPSTSNTGCGTNQVCSAGTCICSAQVCGNCEASYAWGSSCNSSCQCACPPGEVVVEEELKTNSGTGNIIKICKVPPSSCPAGDIAENGCNFHLDEMQSGESKTFYDTTLPKTGSVDAYCEQNGSFTLTNNSCSCQPQCSGAACGADDGCAGTCQAGTCSGGNTCVAGTCACMVSEFLRFCDGPTGPSTGRVFDDALCQCVCPSGTQWNGVGCGTCGDGMVQPGEECDGWTGCVQCKCVDPYIPVDGSNDGECVLRSNCSCEGKSCGSDGCGRSCGSCLVGQTCNASWQCEAARTYHWEIKSVGSKPIGGQGCTAGETCTASILGKVCYAQSGRQIVRRTCVYE